MHSPSRRILLLFFCLAFIAVICRFASRSAAAQSAQLPKSAVATQGTAQLQPASVTTPKSLNPDPRPLLAAPGTELYTAKRGEAIPTIARHYLGKTSYLTSSQLAAAIRTANHKSDTSNILKANETIVIKIFRELHQAGHTILMVTHDPDIARQADRRIELAHGHLHFDSAVHGPGHPLSCPLADTGDCCTAASADDEIRFDHLLEQIWVCGEEGKPAQVERLHASGPAGALPVVPEEPAARVLARMADLHLVALQNGEAELTPVGSQRARDVVRRHRLAERLFKDTFSVDEAEAHTQACKFEHIISPELDERICSFLGHPKTCPHGNPIPPGNCCNGKTKG